MTKPSLAALCAALLTCLVFLSTALHAQVIYVDYPPIAWQSKRLIELDKPIGVKPQPYKTPFLDFKDFKAEFPHTEWLPPTMTILPPEDADTSTCAWALALIQDTVHGDRLPILLFFTHVGKANAMTYIDYDFNGNFRDDGPPMLLGNQMVPRAVEMVSHFKHGYRFYIAEDRSVKVVVDDGKRRLFRFSVAGYSGPFNLDATYAYSQSNNRENTVIYHADGFVAGINAKLDFSWRSLNVGARVGLDQLSGGITSRQRNTVRLLCDWTGACETRYSSFTAFNDDSLPTTRVLLGVELSWMPRIWKAIQLGPVLSPGVFYYTKAYRTAATEDAQFSMNPTPFLEAGLQSWIDVSPKHYLVFRVTAYQNTFRPKGFFEYYNARDVETRQWGMRIGGGFGWRF
jgi:hypothetical protein